MIALRNLGFLEGLSMIALIFVAMPIKYIGGNPEPVRWVGLIHGVLFLIYFLGATGMAHDRGWPMQRLLLLYVASVIPFGPFLLDRRIFPASSDAAPARE